MYHGRPDHNSELPALTPSQALQQRTDATVGDALLKTLSPSITAIAQTDGSLYLFSGNCHRRMVG